MSALKGTALITGASTGIGAVYADRLAKLELITIPSLPDIADWEKYEEARKAMGPNLSHREPAVRYGIQS